MLTEERLYFLSFRENEVEYVLLTKESKNVDSRIAIVLLWETELERLRAAIFKKETCIIHGDH